MHPHLSVALAQQRRTFCPCGAYTGRPNTLCRKCHHTALWLRHSQHAKRADRAIRRLARERRPTDSRTARPPAVLPGDAAMSGYTAAGQPLTGARQARRAINDGAVVVNVGLKNRQHFARLWPVPQSGTAQTGFPLAVLPLRLIAFLGQAGTRLARLISGPRF